MPYEFLLSLDEMLPPANAPGRFDDGSAALSRIRPVKRLPPDLDECSICLEDMERDVSVMPCKHYFHTRCLKTWVTHDMRCPICRYHLIKGRGT